MSSMVSDDAPKPRLCHIKKREDFNGYGFNLHAEKGKAGQFIGKIDPGSPSEDAHLKEGDRIVEVNGTNIGNENHQQVVQRIKAIPDETKLLVVDGDTDKYYRDLKIVVRGDMPNVLCYNSDGTSHIQNETPVSNGIGSEKAESTSSNDIPDDAPRPRNCHLKIWPDFQGYGFNLHAEKGKPGQYIGHVDDGSPAEYAGLKNGDRIIEVNGENIGRDNHAAVVQKIKSNPNATVMLVLDPEAERYYKEKGVVVSSAQSNVDQIECPDNKPEGHAPAEVEAEVNHHVTESEQETKAEVTAEYANVQKSEPQAESEHPVAAAAAVVVDTTEETPKVNGQTEGEEAAEAISESIREMEQAVADDEPEQPKPIDEPEPAKQEAEQEKEEDKVELNNNADIAEDYDVIANVQKPETKEEEKPEPERVPTPEPVPDSPTPSSEPASPPARESVTVGGITFAGSAKEAREKMSKKRRDEVKQQQLSSKDKYNLYMKM